uniref:TEA domain-containing protein n=1 Tax=Haemonchus contortus TaxID=6289 RepID=A0A7I4Y6H0_HAECO|nr:TEA ATTS domain containing protein [Haemonchus contortus]
MNDTADIVKQTTPTTTKIEPNDRLTPTYDTFKKEPWPGATQLNGGQMITLSPPAGDPAGTQPEPTQSSSSAGSDLTAGDAEGVWSVDIDQAFQEALAIYPPCGRRKIIISDEGKMYGRNELIARYIKLRCGKTRTRKQVSSHIQVLARKKMRDEQAKKKAECPVQTPTAAAAAAAVAAVPPPRVPNTPQFPALPSLPQTPHLSDAKEHLAQQLLGKASLLPATMYQTLWSQPFPSAAHFAPDVKPFAMAPEFALPFAAAVVQPQAAAAAAAAVAVTKKTADGIASSKLRLTGFQAYLELPHGGPRVDIVSIPRDVVETETLKLDTVIEKYPKLLTELFERGPSDAFFLAKCWANVSFDSSDTENSLYAVDSYYHSQQKFDISVSTKVCSFGNEVVEKVEVYSPDEENGHYSFRLERSPICEYMVKFISELKKLESRDYMNNVLENFTVLQVVTNQATGETLMVIGFVFEVNDLPEANCSIFRLVA